MNYGLDFEISSRRHAGTCLLGHYLVAGLAVLGNFIRAHRATAARH